MKKSRLLIAFLVLSILIPSGVITYSFFRPDFSKKQCDAIRANLGKIKIGMKKEEVELLLGTRVRTKVYPYAGVLFPNQKTQWEVWLLCKDLESCIVSSSGKYKNCDWQMVAFNTEIGKVVKVFSDDPERVGFV